MKRNALGKPFSGKRTDMVSWRLMITTRKRHPFTAAAAVVCLCLSVGRQAQTGPKARLDEFFAKKRVTIAVTDSGLGGLSVLAEAAERLARAGLFEKVDLVFANALFSNEGGYNALRTAEEKALVFDSALKSITREYRPDLILIACNTLSTIYGRTAFSRKAEVPVIDIIEAGTGLMSASLVDHPGSVVLFFGTPTTVSEGTYAGRLAERGFISGRVLAQACPDLETFIEKDPGGDETAMLIAAYAAEALSGIKDPAVSFAVSLNCTHYAYSLKLWKKAFDELGRKPFAILNPNSTMLDVLFAPERTRPFPRTTVTVRVVSMVKITDERKKAIAGCIEKVSPQTASALRSYELRPGLFEWQKFVSR
jgi:glutamate racemase